VRVGRRPCRWLIITLEPRRCRYTGRDRVLWIAVSRSAPQQRGNSCCLASELLDDLDAPHSANELTEHGRLIAKAGADLQTMSSCRGSSRSAMTATMKGCEIVLSKPICSAGRCGKRGPASGDGTKACRGTRPLPSAPAHRGLACQAHRRPGRRRSRSPRSCAGAGSRSALPS
jgi:hypothetical protein